MSTHSIGFKEDLTKSIFELSSDVIKYAPYFFCWIFSASYPLALSFMSNQAQFYAANINEDMHTWDIVVEFSPNSNIMIHCHIKVSH